MAEDKDTNDHKDVPEITVVETVGRDFRVEGNDVRGYIGVDAEYRTYASDTEKPFITTEDVYHLARSGQLTDVETMSLQNATQEQIDAASGRIDEDINDASEDEEPVEESDKKKADSTPTVGSTGKANTPSTVTLTPQAKADANKK